jgi:phosphoserine aminotransferase
MRRILNIPNDSQIWFIGGGCHLQFAGIPLNYVGNNEKNTVANYTTTGYFSKLSFSEAQRYCTPKSIMDLKKNNDGQFYLEDNYNFDAKAVYTHFIDNESVEGIEYPDSFFPVVEGIPLIDDCSSSFLTKYIDWNKVDMAYAHAQKNCGISGLTVMIVNNKTLKTNPNKILPEICSF